MKLLTGVICFLAMAAGPAFEAATIKRADPNAETGQMIRDPRIVMLAHVSVQNLMAQAYRIRDYQISGPGWLDSERFDVMATLPEGSTKEEFPAMLQNLLRDRFGLRLHVEKKTMTAYVLLPGKKGGLKLNPAPTEVGDVSTSKNGTLRHLSGKVTMPYLAGLLSNLLLQPIVDMSELAGVYDVHLEWSSDEAAGTTADGPPSLSAELREKLGLRLTTRRTPVDMYVVDHVDRVPTEN